MSYGDDSGFTAYLTATGLTLPAGAPSAAILRQRGSSYLDAAYEAMLQCSARTAPLTQERAWPRTGHVTRSGVIVPNNMVPAVWIAASYRAAWLEALTPGWASGSINPNRVTKREKADVLEREFMTPAESGLKGFVDNIDAAIHGMVSPFLCAHRRFYMAVI